METALGEGMCVCLFALILVLDLIDARAEAR